MTGAPEQPGGGHWQSGRFCNIPEGTASIRAHDAARGLAGQYPSLWQACSRHTNPSTPFTFPITMPRTRARAATLWGSPDETEAAFYEALQLGDIELLMSCWAEDDDILCIHPGGPRLLGAGAIRAAFEAMFTHGTVRARPLQVHRVVALTSAVHSVVEQVEVMLPDGLHQAVVLATNVYHKAPEGWRMVAHHASPGGAPDAQVVEAQRHVLH